MFVAENYFCFFATMMGMQIKKKIKVDEITIIEKKSMLGFIKNSFLLLSPIATMPSNCCTLSGKVNRTKEKR
jgi:hypothetical protein